VIPPLDNLYINKKMPGLITNCPWVKDFYTEDAGNGRKVTNYLACISIHGIAGTE